MRRLKITKNKEQKFVEKVLLPLSLGSSFARNLTDDVAEIDGLIIKTDSLCEGVHVKTATNPYKMGHKLIARAISDIASKGGFPLGFTLSLFKTPKTDEAFLTDFIFGMKNFDIPLIGGDIANSFNTHFNANISLFAKKNSYIPHRNGAKVGDFIYITGQIGRAYLGFKNEQEFLSFYETPVPKLSLMQKVISNFEITASIDISDGFMKDLMTLLENSNTGASIDLLKINMPKKNDIAKMLTFGDDYEIIFTSPQEINLEDVSKIGNVISGDELLFLNAENIEFSSFGYEVLI
jgi:thiamine-monophosphate kinase